MKNETWADLVKPVGRWAKKNRGAVSRLAEQMDKRIPGVANWRQQIYFWIGMGDRLVEPQYCRGKVLLEEATKLMAEPVENRAKDSAK